ncbi:hypothetical protein EX30DRAFT_343765 [Ascodesmis nigricans]|uniref:Uncharacterized protein n=1 Tax=Ascodesmis nigricans TaxID=341454 RepID=A0A4S2MRS8_9PEZI|nr:hypothetical protein EX30DRAFT_343765 [Ascodesmis nigricans]
MPSLNNPNLPKRLNPRVISHKRKALRSTQRKVLITSRSRAAIPRTEPAGPKPPTTALGITRAHPASAKKVKKQSRNKLFAEQRRRVEAVEEMVRKGEVEMVDASEVPLSKRQQKLAARKAAVEEHNAKVKSARKTEIIEKAKEGGMEVDEIDI